MKTANKPDIQYSTKEAIADIRPLWLAHFSGDLSTICREEVPLRGYPFGSVVPYILDDNYQPIFYMAGHAEHCQNVLENPKASLIIRQNDPTKRVIGQWRITAIGDVLQLGDDETDKRLKERYFEAYPNARLFKPNPLHNHKEFLFFRFNIKKFRAILGFGKVRWVSADAVFPKEILEPSAQARIIEHMNADHFDTYPVYLKSIGVEPSGEEIKMVAVNPFGVTLSQNELLHFVPFGEFSPNTEAVKNELIRMVRAGREAN